MSIFFCVCEVNEEIIDSGLVSIRLDDVTCRQSYIFNYQFNDNYYVNAISDPKRLF